MIYAPGRYYRGMPDLCAGKTQLGRSVPAAGGSEGREWRLVTPMLVNRCGSLIRHNHLTPGGANARVVQKEKRYGLYPLR